MKGLYEKILAILDEQFIDCEDVARVLALALATELPVLIWGPGGHGKSEMIQAALNGLGHNFFPLSFGEGMSEAKLFGELNMRKLNEEGIIEYYAENSFLNHEYVVFEEIFDAPAVVLMALKDCLTAKALRNGPQQFKMKTKVIVGLTNKDPKDVADFGPAAQALVERFSLQLNLKWETYSAADYNRLFEKVSPRVCGTPMNGFSKVLAEILAKATAEGNFVSPRTAVRALMICQAAAKLRGGNQIEKADLIDLRFLPGLDGLAETITAELSAAMERATAEKIIVEFENQVVALVNEFERARSMPDFMKIWKKAVALQDSCSGLKLKDNQAERRKALRERLSKLESDAKAKALDATHV